jgi:uncharacterized membrane protein YfcA
LSHILKGNPVKKALLIFALAAHGGITAVALWQEGLVGILAAITHNYWAMQIFADLVIALSLVLVWMWRDAKQSDRNIGPWIAFTLVVGSFGPLLHFLTAKKKA